MSEKNWIGRVADKASNQAKSIAAQGRDRASGVAEKLAERVPDVIESLGAPVVPIQAVWEIGFGRFAADLIRVPDRLRVLTRKLDGVGALAISPDAVTIDGTKVAWKDVTELTFGTIPDAFTANVADQMADRLTSVLPRIPGRAWLVRQAMDTLIAVGLVIQGRTPGGPEDGPAHVLMAVNYRGRLGKKEMNPGLFALQVSSLMPDVATALVELSTRHGVKVVIRPASRSANRATAMRDLLGRLQARADQTPDAEPDDDDRESPTVEPASTP
jgi:hypothetical protein